MIPNPFPKAGSGDVQIFNNPSTSDVEWHTWTKPPGCSMVYILCIGGGGGGGGGANGSGSGGGGGGSSPTTRLFVQAALLPKTLYIKVGAGGTGGPASNGSGQNGGISYVAVRPAGIITASNILLKSSTTANPATGAVGVNNGGAGAAATIAEMPLAGLGIWDSVAGQGGQNGGGAGAASVNTTIPVTGVITQGAAGGSGYGNVVGGQITAITNSLLSEVRPIGAALGEGSTGGFVFNKPFFSFAGLSSASSNGASVGHAAESRYGSGGPGGSCGNPNGGNGGKGGDGLVIITSI